MRPLSLSSRVPDPPLPSSIRPLLFTWERNRPLLRCHNTRFTPNEFNPGQGLGRFHPFADPLGRVVSTLYAAEDLKEHCRKRSSTACRSGGLVKGPARPR
jgi:hypothetical protein